MIHDAGVNPVCCGEPMSVIVANTVDASKEKHVPVVTQKGNEVHVAVGSVEHPMVQEHWIQWIYLETSQGGQRKSLDPGQKPEANFLLTSTDKLIAVYEYCNIHGLWKTVL